MKQSRGFVLLMDREPRFIWHKDKVGRQFRDVREGPGLARIMSKPAVPDETTTNDYGPEYVGLPNVQHCDEERTA